VKNEQNAKLRHTVTL